jgi:hypothetical protein
MAEAFGGELLAVPGCCRPTKDVSEKGRRRRMPVALVVLSGIYHSHDDRQSIQEWP